jgi:YHS domain-containing protein
MVQFGFVRSLVALFAVATISGSFALAQKPKPKPVPTTITCAVMTTNKVNIASATKAKMFADYKGKRYFFCCAGCPAAFKANPEKFKASASIPAPKKPKT